MINIKKVGLMSYQFSRPIAVETAAEEKAAVVAGYRRRRLSFKQVAEIKKYSAWEHIVAAHATNLL